MSCQELGGTSREVPSKTADTVRKVAHDPVWEDIETVTAETAE